MKIQVTQEDIDLALISQRAGEKPSGTCPTARALTRAFDTPIVIGLNLFTVGVQVWKASEACPNFIRQFDCGADVDPFEFEVEMEVPNG